MEVSRPHFRFAFDRTYLTRLVGLGSIPEIHVLQWLFNIHLFYEGYCRLQFVAFLGRHSEFVFPE